MRALLALLLMTGASQAQTVMDGSNKNISPEMMSYIFESFSNEVVDPYSLQFRRLRTFTPVGADYEGICGEVNAKNSFGSYLGFRVFQYLPKYNSITLNSVVGC
jgi:hypothetical protein